MVEIFLSFSSEDAKIKKQVEEYLEEAGFSVWKGDDVKPGTPEWQGVMEQAIQEATVVVVILSPDSANSLWVQWELGYAARRELRIFPLLARGYEEISIPLNVKVAQPIDIRRNRKKGLGSLVEVLKEIGVSEAKEEKESIKVKEVPDWLAALDEDLPPVMVEKPKMVRVPKWLWGLVGVALLVVVVWAVGSFTDTEILPEGIPFIARDTATPSSTNTPILPTPTPTFAWGERIFYKSFVDGNSGIYMMDPDGNVQPQLLFEGEIEGGLVSSLNGTKLAYIIKQDEDYEAYVMNVEGSSQVQLAVEGYKRGLTLSPDGTKIAFVSDRDGNEDIYVMDVGGGEITRLTTHEERDYSPAWSPDGNLIVFASSRYGSSNNKIFIKDISSESLAQFTSYAGNYLNPSWSPDGEKIAFIVYRSKNNTDIHIANADGSKPFPLTGFEGIERPPVWSPDSSKLAFTYEYGGTTSIYIVGVDGYNMTLLTEVGWGAETPVWSPDGTKIAFSSNQDGDFEIYVINADGSNLIQLTDNDWDDTYPAWAP